MKEMQTVRQAVTRKNDCTVDEMRQGKQLIGHQEMTGHLVFDIKMDGQFARKARFVADGHKTKTPASLTFASVVSHESVCIVFLIAGLNDLDIWLADIHGVCLNAPVREKVWLEAQAEFGLEQGAVMVVTKALCGLKSSKAAWRSCLQMEIVEEMKFEPTLANPCAC